MEDITAKMEKKLVQEFNPAEMELIDESEKHRGHAGHREGGQSHFRLTIVSTKFEGQSRLQRQRAINAVLAEELAGPVHAFSISAKTPAEVA